MELEKQVSSQELSLKLRELGVPQRVTHGSFAYVQDELHLVHEDNDTGWLVGNDYITTFDCETGMLNDTYEWCKAFTVTELGELLPKDISEEVLNNRFPFEKSREEAKDDDDMLQAEENIVNDLRSVFNELYEPENYTDGFGCGIRLNYGQGCNLYYFLNDDEWECSYQVFQIKADTEADARAKMLVYLIENGLLDVKSLV